jgi:hypothetical protein
LHPKNDVRILPDRFGAMVTMKWHTVEWWLLAASWLLFLARMAVLHGAAFLSLR